MFLFTTFDVSIEGESDYGALCFELFIWQRSRKSSLDIFVWYRVIMFNIQ